MPLLQGQPFRLIKPPENVEPGTELFTIQHTGEKFISKSDYEDRLALYSQSIWTCQCSGKSGMTHQEAWTSESKVRVLLSSWFPAPLWSPVLCCIHHSTQPLDQLVETASALCLSRFHPGEELTYSKPPIQVRVISAREVKEVENGAGPEKSSSTNSNTPLTNGCTTTSTEGPPVNGATNGSDGSNEETNTSSVLKPKEDSPGKKKEMLPLLYNVDVIGEDRKINDVSPKDLQRTYKIPSKENFRLFIRANALRQRSSAFTPWIVSEDLVKQYNIPGKLASVFTQPSFNFTNKKRKLEQAPPEKVKKQKAEKVDPIKTKKVDPIKAKKVDPIKAKKVDPIKTNKDAKDPSASKKKPGPKPGSKRTVKGEPVPNKPVAPGQTKKAETPVKVKKVTPEKMETSDSDDDISLAVLASKSPKSETKSNVTAKSPDSKSDAKPVKRDAEKDQQQSKKMKQATLFDMKAPKSSAGGSGTTVVKRSPQKRTVTPESVMRMPIMRKLLHQRKLYKGVRGMGRKIAYTMDQALNRLSLKQLGVIPDEVLREEMMRRREKVLEKRILSTLSAEDKEAYLKQKALEEKKKKQESKQEQELIIQQANRKQEDKILSHLKALPSPKLVPTPDEIPNSIFGDITMIIEFIECYREIVLTDKKTSISSKHLMQALEAGREGFKFISEIMILLLHIIIDDERIGDNKELGFKISELAVHYQTAIELARLCLGRRDSLDSASQHSDDDLEEECELSEGLIKKLDTHELYELQAVEIIQILKALCHRAMASFTSLEYFEDFDEKYVVLHREYLQIKKEKNKNQIAIKKEKRVELMKQKKEKKAEPPPPRKSQSNTLESFIKKEDEPMEDSPDIISVVKRKRMTADQLRKEKEETSKEMKEKWLKENEEKKKQMIISQWEKVNVQREVLLRLKPLGVDRNHDRYWLFNSTTPGLYVEKGWADVNTTYCVKSTSSKKESESTPRTSSKKETEKTPHTSSKKEKGKCENKSSKSIAKALSFSTPEKISKVPDPTSRLPEVSSALSSTNSGAETAKSKSPLTLIHSAASNASSPVSSISQCGPSSHSEDKKPDVTKLISSGSSSVDDSVITKSDSIISKSDLVKSEINSVSVCNTSPNTVVATSVSDSAVIANGPNSVALNAVKCVDKQSTSVVPLSTKSTSNVCQEPKVNPDCNLDSNEKSLSIVKEELDKPLSAVKEEMDKPLSAIKEEMDKPLSAVKEEMDMDKPLSAVKEELHRQKEETPLSESKEKPTEVPVKRRGRPPKPRDPNEVKTPPRPRGRPPTKDKTPKTPKPRGRPPKPKTPILNPDGTPVKESPRPRGRPKVVRTLNADETFPPVGQNMWFYYNSLEEVDALENALTDKGIRESKLKNAIVQARKHMETNFVKEWQPLEDFVDGAVQLLETLREDILQIEKELCEGWLGSVPDTEAWEKKAEEATTVQELGECLIEAQRHIQIKYLKGMMKPVRKPIPQENPEVPQEYEEIECPAVQQWRNAVGNCSTLSRLHLLVGMFDSCIKWEKSMATKKCKVCRTQDTSLPLALCETCDSSYHWHCMRPQLTEEPPESWLCPACQPNKNKERRQISINQVEEEREEPQTSDGKPEKICRVCERGIGLIFCSVCPAAYHSECHDPPLQTRARKDWKCVDCMKKKPKSRSSRAKRASAREEVSRREESKKETRRAADTRTSSRGGSRRKPVYAEVEESGDNEEEDEENENSDSEEEFSTCRKSRRVRKTVNPPRRTTSRAVKKKSYKIESEEEEEEAEEEEEEEEEAEGEEEVEEAEGEEEEEQDEDDQQDEDEQQQEDDEDEQQQEDEEDDEQQEDEEDEEQQDEEEDEDQQDEEEDEEQQEDEEDENNEEEDASEEEEEASDEEE